MKIHSTLGKRFNEIVYKDAMEINARKRIFPMKEKNNLTSGTRGLFSAINLSPIFLSSTLSFLEVKATWQLRQTITLSRL